MTHIDDVNKAVTVLVVDDHSMTRTMVKAILRGVGFSDVLQAENGAEAVRIINEEKRIGLVICDWNMPVANGLEVLKTVRAEKQFAKLPFLMLTAEAYRENVEAAVLAGVTDYVIKPFTAETLLEKIGKVLSRKT